MRITRMMVLNTAHLRGTTAHALNSWARLPLAAQPLAVATTQCGWLVPTRDDGLVLGKSVPPELADILAFARSRDCAHVLFDSDGPVEPTLLRFPW
ncbi:hypothetical protein BH10PSE12_BH10PSE12_07860 [soil metagenome]